MAALTVLFGVLLILLGGGISAADIVMTGKLTSPTSFIPCAFGVLLAILGAIALIKKDSRKARMITMHIAVVIGVLGMLAPFGRIIPLYIKESVLPSGLPAIGLAGLISLCLLYVVLCVLSFIKARKNMSTESVG